MGWDEFYIVFSIIINGIALRNLYVDYSKAEDKINSFGVPCGGQQCLR